ncbi:hypothetical protein LTR36_006419 [Oleoguttula mirabilis]|uniref:Uncharacterized protein n=1 Tax=Oleoguttula mirabilis TaxID=1507867 RepID=A0AAV9JUN4_9PEZI|nr:hypothetical protein LTR36_006419 [Oleoguttula mirabilis]
MFDSYWTPKQANKAADAAQPTCHFNSSNSVAENAHTHNDYVTEHYREAVLAKRTKIKANELPLLAFPPKVCAQICREMVADSSRTIIISAQAPAQSSEPGVTTLCHDVRDLSLPAFYLNNQFVVQVEQYDVRAVLPWLERYERFQDKEESERVSQVSEPIKPFVAKTQTKKYSSEQVYHANFQEWLKRYNITGAKEDARTTPAKRSGGIIIRTDGDPHWGNLQEWLKLAHAGDAVPLKVDDYEGGEQDAAVKGAFTVVMGMVKYPWPTVKRVLPGLRQMLVAGDARWAAVEDGVRGVADDAVPATEDMAMDNADGEKDAIDEPDLPAEDTEMHTGEEEDEAVDDSGVFVDEQDAPPEDTEMHGREEPTVIVDDSEDEPEVISKRVKTEHAMDGTQDDEQWATPREERIISDDSDDDDVAATLRGGYRAALKRCR